MNVTTSIHSVSAIQKAAALDLSNGLECRHSNPYDKSTVAYFVYEQAFKDAINAVLEKYKKGVKK